MSKRRRITRRTPPPHATWSIKDLALLIFGYVPYKDLRSHVLHTCKDWASLIKDTKCPLWKHLDMRDWSAAFLRKWVIYALYPSTVSIRMHAVWESVIIRLLRLPQSLYIDVHYVSHARTVSSFPDSSVSTLGAPYRLGKCGECQKNQLLYASTNATQEDRCYYCWLQVYRQICSACKRAEWTAWKHRCSFSSFECTLAGFQGICDPCFESQREKWKKCLGENCPYRLCFSHRSRGSLRMCRVCKKDMCDWCLGKKATICLDCKMRQQSRRLEMERKRVEQGLGLESDDSS